MKIDSNTLIFPNDEQELIDMYFDDIQYRSLKDRYTACSLYLKNQLTSQQKVKMGLSGADATQIAKELTLLKKRVFQAALSGFIAKACEQQILICEQHFSNESSDSMSSIPLPDIYDKDQYFRLESWWQSLSDEEKENVLNTFPDKFGEYNPNDNIPIGEFCQNNWLFLSLEDKENIYQHFNK